MDNCLCSLSLPPAAPPGKGVMCALFALISPGARRILLFERSLRPGRSRLAGTGQSVPDEEATNSAGVASMARRGATEAGVRQVTRLC